MRALRELRVRAPVLKLLAARKAFEQERYRGVRGARYLRGTESRKQLRDERRLELFFRTLTISLGAGAGLQFEDTRHRLALCRRVCRHALERKLAPPPATREPVDTDHAHVRNVGPRYVRLFKRLQVFWFKEFIDNRDPHLLYVAKQNKYVTDFKHSSCRHTGYSRMRMQFQDHCCGIFRHLETSLGVPLRSPRPPPCEFISAQSQSAKRERGPPCSRAATIMKLLRNRTRWTT